MKKSLLLIGLAFAARVAIVQAVDPTVAFDWADVNEDVSGQWINSSAPGAAVAVQPEGVFALNWAQTSGDSKDVWITDLKIGNFAGNAAAWAAYGADAAIQFDYTTLKGDTVFAKFEYDVEGGSNYYGNQAVALASGTWKTLTQKLSEYTFSSAIGAALDSVPSTIKIGLNNSPIAAKDASITFLIDNIKVVNAANAATAATEAFDWADVNEDVSGQWINSSAPGAAVAVQPEGVFALNWAQTSGDSKDVWITDLKIGNFAGNAAAWAEYGADAGIQFDYTTLKGDTVFAKFEYDVEGGSNYYGNQAVALASGTWKTLTQKLSEYTFSSAIGAALDSVPSTIKIGLNNSPIAAKDASITFLIDNIKVVNTAIIDGINNAGSIASTNSIILSPNPVVNSFKLKNVSGSNIYIFDMSGRQVFSLKNVLDGQTISVNNLSSGMYILRANQQAVKFVKR